MDIVVGYGVVGKATAYAWEIDNYIDIGKRNIDYSDAEKGTTWIICVPTPTINGKQDLTEIKKVLEKIIASDEDPTVVIRSTILPGTTTQLENEFTVDILFVPEFLTESSSVKDTLNSGVLVGGNNHVKRHIFSSRFDESIETSPETAELVKYAMNTFFGTKVVLGNIFRDIADKTGADYWAVKGALETHKWGSVNGWNPFYGSKRGFGGKCLPKDIEAISELDSTGFLKSLIKTNEKYRAK